MPGAGYPPSFGSDESLVDRLRSGDERALAELFERMAPVLARFGARYPVRPAVVEDVLAAVFVSLWNRRAELDPQASLTTYLYRAVRNGILDAMRRSGREQARYERELASGVVPGMAVRSAAADAEVEAGNRAGILWSTARQLPEQQYTALWLRYTNGMSLQEIAESMEISVAAVKSLLQRAHRTLRDRLGGIFEYL